MKLDVTKSRRLSLFVCLVFFCLVGASITAQGALEWKQDELTLTATVTDVELFGAYDFENKGSTPVRILGVHSSCTCMSATASALTVEAGGKAKIQVVFKLEGKVGPQKYKTVVETDDGSPPKKLTLKVNLPEWITFTSENLTWIKGEPREVKSVDVALMPELEATEVTVSSSSEVLKAELQLLVKDGGYRVILRPAPGDTPLKVKVTVHVKLKSDLTKNASFFVSLP